MLVLVAVKMKIEILQILLHCGIFFILFLFLIMLLRITKHIPNKFEPISTQHSCNNESFQSNDRKCGLAGDSDFLEYDMSNFKLFGFRL